MRFRVTRNTKLGLVVLCAALLLPGCGGKKKRYFEQVSVLIEQNDAIDARAAQLPKINAFKDPDYQPKLEGYIASKQNILRQLETLEPPFMISTTHAKLIQAMKNGIRYLQSEREKFLIAAQRMAESPKKPGEPQEMEIIREYQSQAAAYQADMKEQLMEKDMFL